MSVESVLIEASKQRRQELSGVGKKFYSEARMSIGYLDMAWPLH